MKKGVSHLLYRTQQYHFIIFSRKLQNSIAAPLNWISFLTTPVILIEKKRRQGYLNDADNEKVYVYIRYFHYL
jgi:hypothetical protein